MYIFSELPRNQSRMGNMENCIFFIIKKEAHSQGEKIFPKTQILKVI